MLYYCICVDLYVFLVLSRHLILPLLDRQLAIWTSVQSRKLSYTCQEQNWCLAVWLPDSKSTANRG